MALPQKIIVLTLNIIGIFLNLLIRLLAFCVRALNWLKGKLSELFWQINVKIKYLRFSPRPDDIFVVTYPRSGTTWMQMIVYQLTTDGNMDFESLEEVSPWIEDPETPSKTYNHLPSPRIIKSHASYNSLPKWPGRYIYVARDGRDVAVSFFHLFRTYYGFKGPFSDFFDQYVMTEREWGGWFKHVESWYTQKHNPNILLLNYEDLKQDFEGCLEKIITFCKLDIDPNRLPEILHRCSFEFMKQHERKFVPFKDYKANPAFIRQGHVGKGKEQFTPQQQDRFNKEFKKRLEKFGSFDNWKIM